MNENPPDKLLEDAAETYRRKAADYDPRNDFENFRFSAGWGAKVCRGLTEDDPRRSVVNQIGIKMSRLATVGLSATAKNEGILDTIDDACVYLKILQSMQLAATPAPRELVLPVLPGERPRKK